MNCSFFFRKKYESLCFRSKKLQIITFSFEKIRKSYESLIFAQKVMIVTVSIENIIIRNLFVRKINDS